MKPAWQAGPHTRRRNGACDAKPTGAGRWEEQRARACVCVGGGGEGKHGSEQNGPQHGGATHLLRQRQGGGGASERRVRAESQL